MAVESGERGRVPRAAAVGSVIGAASGFAILLGMGGSEVLDASRHNQGVIECANELTATTQEVRAVGPGCDQYKGRFALTEEGAYILPARDDFVRNEWVDVSDRVIMGGIIVSLCAGIGASVPSSWRLLGFAEGTQYKDWNRPS